MSAIKTVKNEIINGNLVVTTYYKSLKKTVTRIFSGKYKVCIYRLKSTHLGDGSVRISQTLIYSNITY